MFERITLNSGKILLVAAPTEEIYDLIRAHHQLLLDSVTCFRNFESPTADSVLFEEFSEYYSNIANLLTPTFNPSLLTPLSRHQFFIATESISHPKDPNLLIRGLSKLEQLMGFEYDLEAMISNDTTSTITPEVIISTGDLGLDIKAYLLLNCKENVQWLIKSHSRKQLTLILEQMSNIPRKDEIIKERQQQSDRLKFEQSAADIAHYLQSEGIAVPGEFVKGNREL